jgi:formylmethanofuran dehydrogenase subunit E
MPAEYPQTWKEAQQIARYQRSRGYSAKVTKLKRPVGGRFYKVEYTRIKCYNCGKFIPRKERRKESLLCTGCRETMKRERKSKTGLLGRSLGSRTAKGRAGQRR